MHGRRGENAPARDGSVHWASVCVIDAAASCGKHSRAVPPLCILWRKMGEFDNLPRFFPGPEDRPKAQPVRRAIPSRAFGEFIYPQTVDSSYVVKAV